MLSSAMQIACIPNHPALARCSPVPGQDMQLWPARHDLAASSQVCCVTWLSPQPCAKLGMAREEGMHPDLACAASQGQRWVEHVLGVTVWRHSAHAQAACGMLLGSPAGCPHVDVNACVDGSQWNLHQGNWRAINSASCQLM